MDLLLSTMSYRQRGTNELLKVASVSLTSTFLIALVKGIYLGHSKEQGQVMNSQVKHKKSIVTYLSLSAFLSPFHFYENKVWPFPLNL